MKNFLLASFCGLFVVGVANLGHAFLFFGEGGGGSKNQELPDSNSNPDYEGAIFCQFDFASNRYRGNGGSDPLAQINGAVSEPATMILLGLGLIGLAGYGRVKLNK